MPEWKAEAFKVRGFNTNFLPSAVSREGYQKSLEDEAKLLQQIQTEVDALRNGPRAVVRHFVNDVCNFASAK